LYVVVRCPRCGELLLAKTDAKTRSCTSCGHRAEIATLLVLGRANTPADAVEMMKQLKAKAAGKEDYRPTFRHIGPRDT